MRSRLAVSLPRSRLSAWPGTQVPACFLLSEAMMTHHLPLTRPRPLMMEVEPFLLLLGVIQAVQGAPGAGVHQQGHALHGGQLALGVHGLVGLAGGQSVFTMWAWMSSSMACSSATFSGVGADGLAARRACSGNSGAWNSYPMSCLLSSITASAAGNQSVSGLWSRLSPPQAA